MNLPRCFCLGLFFIASSVSADSYKPLFSKELLDKANPEARARMEALDAENRRRWEAANPQNEPVEEISKKKVIYRYVDAAGKVQFSESPVGDSSVAIEVEANNPSEQSRKEHAQNQQAQKDMLADFEERQKIRDRQNDEISLRSRKQEENKQRCHKLFIDIQDYRRGGIAYYELDENGNRHYLSEREVEDEIVSLESLYEKKCGALPDRENR